MSAYPRKPSTDGCGVSIAAGISSTVSIPVELVTPTVIGSPSTQSYGTTRVLERRRPSVVGPSTVYRTIASSTFTLAIVRSSGCGLRTVIRISPGENSTRRMSNSSAGGGFVPTRSASDEPLDTTAPTASASRSTGTTAQIRQFRRTRSRRTCVVARAWRRFQPRTVAPRRRPRRSPSTRARRTPTGARGT